MHYLVAVFNKDASNSKKIYELLLSHGAKINQRNNEGWTPLHISIQKS